MTFMRIIALLVVGALTATPAFAGSALKWQLEEDLAAARAQVQSLEGRVIFLETALTSETSARVEAEREAAKQKARADLAERKLAEIEAAKEPDPAPPEVDPDIALAESFGLDLGHMSPGQKIWFALYKKHRHECFSNGMYASLSPLGKQACYEAEDKMRLELISVPTK